MDINENRVVRAGKTSRPCEVVIRFKPAPKAAVCPSRRWGRLLLAALLRKLRELNVRLAVLAEQALARESPEVVLAVFTEDGGDLVGLMQLHQLRVAVQNWRWGRDEIAAHFFAAVERVHALMVDTEEMGEDEAEDEFEKNFIAAKPFLEWLGPPLDLPV